MTQSSHATQPTTTRRPDRTAAPQTHATLFTPATRQAPPRVCVIAELGVNHDGKLDRALELTEAAARTGADAIKLQLFDPRFLLSNQAKLAVYQEGKAEDPFKLLDNLKLHLDDMLAVRAAARRLGVAFIVTPFSLENFDWLKALDADAVKIASPDAVNYPLLSLVASLGKPMIISTGTAELKELEFAAKLITESRNRSSCLLQCVSSYPTPAEDAALGGIRVMACKFELPVGYSDHTTEVATGALAVAAGACVIEKHLTYNPKAYGPDHAASFDEPTFTKYVKLIRMAAAMHGPTDKNIRGVEADVRSVSRQSVCALGDLPAGHTLTRADVTIKRPGTGVPAAHLEKILGRKLHRAVKGNDLLKPDDV